MESAHVTLKDFESVKAPVLHVTSEKDGVLEKYATFIEANIPN